MSIVSEQEYSQWLRLAFAALPTGRARQLLRQFDGPQAIFEAAATQPKLLTGEFGLTERALQKLRDCAIRDVAKQLDAMQQHGVHLVTEDEYPPLLTQIEDDCPPFLFIRGQLQAADQNCVAIVGTRNMTEYGRGLAHRFALEFARAGWTVVSGLARGIDTAAHRGALDGGGRTIAVTGCGLDIVYPSDNRDLMLEIEQSGAVVSEWAPTTPPEAWHFPARNRIIAGLAHGVVVVESKLKSGALITATQASKWGREVFAVPGNVHKAESRGPHQLLKEGAILAESAEDVLAYLAGQAFDREILTAARQAPTSNSSAAGGERIQTQSRPPKASPLPEQQVKAQASAAPVATPRLDFSPNENRVWVCLDVEPRHLDDITSDAQIESGAANAALVLLEIKGAARRLPGNLFVKVT